MLDHSLPRCSRRLGWRTGLKNIFLSASVPDREPWARDSDHIAIREAILALIETAGKNYRIVFGGHPAITPMVEYAARSIGVLENITIFQSRFFARDVPQEVFQLKHINWIKSVDDDRDASLALMREEMIDFANYELGFFIGGMEGVVDEWILLANRQMQHNATAFPLGTTGGASAAMLEIFRDVRRPWTIVSSYDPTTPKEIIRSGREKFLERFNSGQTNTPVDCVLFRLIQFLDIGIEKVLPITTPDQALYEQLKEDTDYRRLFHNLLTSYSTG